MSSSRPAIQPSIHEGWRTALVRPEADGGDLFNTESFHGLRDFLRAEKQAGKTLYPPGPEIFSAFDHTPFDAVKVVIIGQDPYHGPGQANGLCFSVAPGVKTPPSLRNIFKEIHEDLAHEERNVPMPSGGDLRPWAEQGVLLLNATLTVEAHQAGSHQNKGWEPFTDGVIRTLSAEREGLVFLLWGGFAKRKKNLIDASRHHILEAAHPSPLAAHKGFFGCRHFSKTNAILKAAGQPPIDWAIA